MSTILTTKFDSDEEDDEYVPKEDKKSNNNTIEKPEDIFSQLLTQKRKKRSQALWDEMKKGAENDLHQLNKRLKTSEEDKNEGIAKNVDIEVINQEKKEFSECEGGLGENEKALCTQEETAKDNSISEAMAAIKEMNKRNTKLTENVRFAGTLYSIQKDATPDAIKKIQNKDRQKSKGVHCGLDALVNKIDNQTRTISSVTKSKLDWKDYTNKNTIISKDLEKNRKDGYIGKKTFLEKSQYAERYLQKKRK